MKLIHLMGTVALAGSISMGLVACKKGSGGAVITTLTKDVETSLGVKPMYVMAFNLKAIRNAPPAQEALKKFRKKMVTSIKKSPMKNCNAEKLVDQLDSAVILGFDNLNLNYFAIKGSFDAVKLAACMEKSAKKTVTKKKMHGVDVYTDKGSYIWVPNKSSVVGLVSPPRGRSPLGAGKLKIADVLKKLLTGKNVLASGQIPALGSQALSFRLTGLSSIKNPMLKMVPFKIPNTIWGSVQISNDLDLSLNLEMAKKEDAAKVSAMYTLVSGKVPPEFKDSIKVTNKKKLLAVSFKHNVKKLVAFAKAEQAKRAKRRKMRRSFRRRRFRRNFKVKQPMNQPSVKREQP